MRAERERCATFVSSLTVAKRRKAYDAYESRINAIGKRLE
jgi:hypothetical protein